MQTESVSPFLPFSGRIEDDKSKRKKKRTGETISCLFLAVKIDLIYKAASGDVVTNCYTC